MKRIVSETLKLHYCSDEVSEAVLEDLNKNYPDEEHELSIEPLAPYCEWDPGGSLLTGDITLEFRLDGMTVRCKTQFLEAFFNSLERRKKDGPRGNNTKFYKLHGGWVCICITPSDFDILYKLVSDKDLQEQAVLTLRKKIETLAGLSKNGSILQVDKDPEGNLKKVKFDKSLN
jgi:hypothetical protein